MDDSDPPHSLFEPNEERPSWALSPEQFTRLVCGECQRPFEKDRSSGVVGGLMILYDDEAPDGKRYFHGYGGASNSCYARAERKFLGDA